MCGIPFRALAPGKQLFPEEPAESWSPNQGLTSPSNTFQLIYQSDGNLILYMQDPAPVVRVVLLSAGTNTDLSQYPRSYSEMMPNGQFAILHESADGDLTAQWCMKAEPGSSLCLGDDGSLYFQVLPGGDPTEVFLSDPSKDCVAPSA